MERDSRRLERVHLYDPIPGRVGIAEIYVLDLSLEGLRVAHQRPLGDIGSVHSVQFSWRGDRLEMPCKVVRTELQRVGSTSFSKTLYHSALALTSPPPPLMREIVEYHVKRALDEQRANAQGIPAVAAQSFQTGKGTEYLRHELATGAWKTTVTTDPGQPRGGFTISAHENKEDVARLREAYEKGDFTAREMIRKMAELSISNAEGIPTRRYTP